MKKLLLLFLLVNSPIFCQEDVEEITAKKFSYDGHEYIKFENYNIVHDPECPCKKSWSAKILNPDGSNKWIYIYRQFVHPKYL